MDRFTVAAAKDNPDDTEIVQRLDRKIFEGDTPVHMPGSFWWILYANDEPVGFAGVRIIEGGESGYLYRAGILPQYRGKGLQKRLIRVREKWCRKQNLKSCVTYVLPNNTASLNNLLRVGYVSYKPTYVYGPKPRWCVYLRKNI